MHKEITITQLGKMKTYLDKYSQCYFGSYYRNKVTDELLVLIANELKWTLEDLQLWIQSNAAMETIDNLSSVISNYFEQYLPQQLKELKENEESVKRLES